jgi:hypothetical protein
MKLVLSRFSEENGQTLGLLNVMDNSNRSLCELKTLELPWLDNAIGKSCIPCGNYAVTKRWSMKYGHHFLVNNVPGRSMVLIHSGNFKSQTRGCILVGLYLAYLDNTVGMDVCRSRDALEILDLILPLVSTIEIQNDSKL